MKEGGVYKKRKSSQRRRGISKKEKLEQEHCKKNMNSVFFLCNFGLLRRACIKIFTFKFYNIKFFLLIFILG